MTEPRVMSLLTCLEVTGEDRPTLHDVFHALSFVPRDVFVYVEFIYSDAFAFVVRLVNRNGTPVVQSETHLILPSLAGRMAEIVGLPVQLAGTLPGGYTVEVVNEDSGDVMERRPVFFGEM